MRCVGCGRQVRHHAWLVHVLCTNGRRWVGEGYDPRSHSTTGTCVQLRARYVPAVAVRTVVRTYLYEWS